MLKYTTGELAKLCGVSVRTVQFYDEKGLLPPTELTEGGRRLYTDDDLSKLRLICLLKDLGLSLGSIRDVLENPKSLCLLLDEQVKKLNDEVSGRKTQLDAIKIVKENLQHTPAIPVNSITGIDSIVENKKKLDRLYYKFIAVAFVLAIPQWGSVAWWIIRGDWRPFAIVWSLLIPAAAIMLRVLHKNRAFICAECGATFKPRFWQSVHASGTGQPVWKLTCTKCGHYGVCVEVYAKESK